MKYHWKKLKNGDLVLDHHGVGRYSVRREAPFSRTFRAYLSNRRTDFSGSLEQVQRRVERTIRTLDQFEKNQEVSVSVAGLKPERGLLPIVDVVEPKEMKIQPNGMFTTPKSADEILGWIHSHPQNDQVHLLTVMMMTWNYLASKVNE